MVMKVSVSQFKARMGEHMRAVREGRQVTITDRGEPIATLVPALPSHRAATIEVSRPREPGAPPLGAIDVRSISCSGTDTTAMLRAERDRR